MEQLSFLFNEAEVFAEVSTKQEEAVVVAAHKRHKKHEYTLDNIPEGIPQNRWSIVWRARNWYALSAGIP